jgi:hypothetical protein
MLRLCILPVVGLIAALGFACGDSGDNVPASLASAVPTSTTTAAASQTPADQRYSDDSLAFALTYPLEWRLTTVSLSQTIRDFAGAIEFFDNEGLRRASLYVYGNPNSLKLNEWIQSHDPIFFDTTPETAAIDGQMGLLVRQINESPGPLAYVEHADFVYGISGLTKDDYERVLRGLQLISKG